MRYGALVLIGAALVAVTAGSTVRSTPVGIVVSDVRAADVVRVDSLDATAATTVWCGEAATADRTPNVVAGNPVHWVYALPSDGPDNVAALASVMQADAEAIDTWWRGQDPARVPRNDLAAFPCGTQLDITTVRIARTSAELSSLQGRFSAIVDALDAAGLGSRTTKYVVYYDGPTGDANICGQGGSDPSGFGAAVVYYRSCVGVSTAAVAAHEVLHTLGAVSRSAPNGCTGERSGHVCDDQRDLMYPAIGGEPLSEKILDLNRDDYYGHAGAWGDTQDSTWLVRLDAQAPLTVNVSGPGSVAADIPGLSCAASCTTTWNTGQSLVLTATPSPGARLVGWTGACAGSAGCILTVAPGATVTAQFAQAAFRLRVAVVGRGAVRSSRAGITCRPRCSAAFPSFAPVRLTATPAKGWKLRAWSGACRGAKRTCTVPMSAATNARATFVRR